MDCVGPLKTSNNLALFQLTKKSGSQKERNLSEVLWYLLLVQRVKTIASAPSRIVLVLNPFPSNRSDKCQNVRQWVSGDDLQIIKQKLAIHCPIEDPDCFSENPKLMHRLKESGSMPPPSSVW